MIAHRAQYRSDEFRSGANKALPAARSAAASYKPFLVIFLYDWVSTDFGGHPCLRAPNAKRKRPRATRASSWKPSVPRPLAGLRPCVRCHLHQPSRTNRENARALRASSSIFASSAPLLRSRHTRMSDPMVPPVLTNGSITTAPV